MIIAKLQPMMISLAVSLLLLTALPAMAGYLDHELTPEEQRRSLEITKELLNQVINRNFWELSCKLIYSGIAFDTDKSSKLLPPECGKTYDSLYLCKLQQIRATRNASVAGHEIGSDCSKIGGATKP